MIFFWGDLFEMIFLDVIFLRWALKFLDDRFLRGPFLDAFIEVNSLGCSFLETTF